MKSTAYNLLNLFLLTGMLNSVQAQDNYYDTNVDTLLENNNAVYQDNYQRQNGDIQYDNANVQYADGSEYRQNQNNPNQPRQNTGYGQTQPNNQQYPPTTQPGTNNTGLGDNLYRRNNSNPNYNSGQNSRQNPNTGRNPGSYTNIPNPQYNPNFNPNQTGSQANLNNGELKDFGVQPTRQLYAGNPHGPTPSSIPGGRVITTNQLQSMVMNGQSNTLIFDVLDGPQHLPGAIPASQGAAPGNFSDQTQQKMGQFLSQVTRGNKQTAMVYYCQCNYCWMSYNAALRAINLGYTNVYWYRGGIEAWQTKGLSVQYASNNRNY